MKTQNYVQFEVPANGFEWVPPPFRYGTPPSALDDCTQEPAMVAAPTKSKPRLVIVPDKLFLDFAQLSSNSPMEVVEFANSYGWLGIHPRWHIVKGRPGKEPDSGRDGVMGELHSDWSASIREMRRLVELWQAIKTEDTELLAIRLRRTGLRQLQYVGTKREHRGRIIYDHSETIDLSGEESELKENDVVSWAFVYLIRTVNKNLINHVTSCLRWDPQTGRVGKFILPTSLNGAMWNQLATAIDDFASLRECDECGKPMIINTGEYRASRRFCSNACRIRVYGARKHEARRMYYEERMPLKDIAVHLDTTVAQIKKWTEQGLQAKRRAS